MMMIMIMMMLMIAMTVMMTTMIIIQVIIIDYTANTPMKSSQTGLQSLPKTAACLVSGRFCVFSLYKYKAQLVVINEDNGLYAVDICLTNIPDINVSHV